MEKGIKYQFQSTLPRGERRKLQTKSRNKKCFNPRSREGSDQEITNGEIFYQGFNPRSREGSDDMVNSLKIDKEVSIHAPARGATTADSTR